MEELNKRQKILYICIIVVIQLFQLSGVILIAHLNKAEFEVLGLYFGMVAGKLYFGKSWHANSVFACSIITFATFYVLTKSVPSSNISIMMSVVIGLILAFVLYKLALLKEKEELYFEIIKKKQKINELSFEELEKLCNKKSISKTDTEFLYYYLKKPNGETNEDLAYKYHFCDGQYVSRRAKRLIKKIES